MSAKRILNVGLGGRGRYWLSLVRAHSGFKSIGWVDPSDISLTKARESAPELDVPVYASVREAMDEVQADIAIIAAAATGRRDNCLEAIDAGLHILVEKPFALTLADAKAIVTAAEQRGTQIVVGQNYRYVPNIARMEQMIREGQLGELGVGCFFRTRRRFGAGTYQQYMPHNYLWEMSVHDYDLIRFTLGLNPRTIEGWSWRPPWGDYSGETTVQVLMEFENNVRVNYLGAWASWVGEYFWRIDGSTGVLRAGRELEFAPVEGGEYIPVKIPPGGSSEWPLMDELLEAIQTGTPARTSGRDNLWTIAMLEATQVASDQDTPVDISALVNG